MCKENRPFGRFFYGLELYHPSLSLDLCGRKSNLCGGKSIEVYCGNKICNEINEPKVRKSSNYVARYILLIYNAFIFVFATIRDYGEA